MRFTPRNETENDSRACLRGESGRAGAAAVDRSPRLSPPSEAVRRTRETLERHALSRYASREGPGDDDMVTGLERVRDSLSDVGTAFDCPALTPDAILYGTQSSMHARPSAAGQRIAVTSPSTRRLAPISPRLRGDWLAAAEKRSRR